MKSIIYLLLIVISLMSCKNSIVNLGLSSIGAYKDDIQLKKINYKQKDIVFIPMHHLGTTSFYNDVQRKVDSLKNENYYFLYEKLNIDHKNDEVLRKFRKLLSLPISRPNSGYKKILDSLYPNIKYKKELIDQISYEKLGLNIQNSEKADAEFKDLVEYYEKKYGEIKLTDCDYNTSYYDKYTKCKEENKIPRKQADDIIINFRNDFAAKKISESSHNKIAIIYGAAHIEGIIEKLSKEK